MGVPSQLRLVDTQRRSLIPALSGTCETLFSLRHEVAWRARVMGIPAQSSLGSNFSIEISGENVTAYTEITSFLEAELAVTGSDDQDEIDTIPTSYEDRYWLLRPIPVEFEDVAADAVIAHFHKAELAVTGSFDRQDAKVSLASWIFDIFEDLAAANPQTLGRHSRLADPRTERVHQPARMISKREAQALATKLGCEPVPGGKHTEGLRPCGRVLGENIWLLSRQTETKPPIADCLGMFSE